MQSAKLTSLPAMESASHRIACCHVRSYAPCPVTPCAYMRPNLFVSFFFFACSSSVTERSDHALHCTARPWKPTCLHRRFFLFYFPMQGIRSGFCAPTAAKSFTSGQITRWAHRARMHFSCLVCKTRRVFFFLKKRNCTCVVCISPSLLSRLPATRKTSIRHSGLWQLELGGQPLPFPWPSYSLPPFKITSRFDFFIHPFCYTSRHIIYLYT